MNHRTEAFDEAYENLSIPKQGTFLTGEGAMDLAWRLALQGVGLVRSNPLVGAVCVDKDHKFVAGAYHQSFGKAHAEQALIKKIYEEGLEDFLNEGTVYVTLEPCSHIGKTPSCAHLLSEQPLKSVVYGVPDPTEKTSGKGPLLLKESGKSVQLFSSSAELKEKLYFLVESFYHFEKHKSPFVCVKVASSLNGVFARLGDSREWITGERARQYGQWLRLVYDSIVVGANTVISDNPALTVRSYKLRRTPYRVILDPHGKALSCRPLREQRVLQSEPEKVFWCLKEKSWESLSIKSRSEFEALGLSPVFLRGKFHEDIFQEVLAFLFAEGIASLLVEGGAQVWASAFKGNKVNKLCLFQAPKLICHEEKLYWTKDIKINYLEFESVRTTCLKKDLLIEGNTRDYCKL